MRHKINNKSMINRIKIMIGSLVVASLMFFFFFPIVNLFVDAFRSDLANNQYLPQNWSVKWFSYVLDRPGVIGSFIMSFLVAIVTTLVSMCICIPAAYSFARFNFVGKKLCYFSFLLSNAFPRIGLYASIGVMFYKLNLMGTFAGVIIIHVINSLMMMIWISSTSFKSVSMDQEEAAKDVGAGPIRTFFYVTLPLAWPGIMVASLFTFLGSMEEGAGTLLVGLPNIKTLPVEMYSVIFDYPGTAGAALALMLLVPIIVILVISIKLLGAKSILDSMKIN